MPSAAPPVSAQRLPRLPSVLLFHQCRDGAHYDWLMADPADPTGLLWAARVPVSSRAWRPGSLFPAQEIAPHRRLYLDYQGPLSAGRGLVLRVDQGTFVPLHWSADRRALLLEFSLFCGRLELRRPNPAAPLWAVRVGGRKARAGLVHPASSGETA